MATNHTTPGTRIRVGDNARPKRLIGRHGTVVGMRRTNVLVALDATPTSDPQWVVCPPKLLTTGNGTPPGLWFEAQNHTTTRKGTIPAGCTLTELADAILNQDTSDPGCEPWHWELQARLENGLRTTEKVITFTPTLHPDNITHNITGIMVKLNERTICALPGRHAHIDNDRLDADTTRATDAFRVGDEVTLHTDNETWTVRFAGGPESRWLRVATAT